MLRYYIQILICFFALQSIGQPTLSSQKKVIKLMGTRFEITATANSDKTAWQAIETGIKEIERIETLISSWQDDSQTSEINKNAGIIATKVDVELFDLIERSLKISKLTSGAFDISYASIDRLYNFDKLEHTLPNSIQLKKSIKNIDWSSIILDRDALTVFLPKKGMKIGFGGIGKGYAANSAKNLMSKIVGVQGGVVNAAGDLIVWGENGKEDGWPIQISDPKNKERTLGWLYIENTSVVTSGDYEKYFTSGGRRYAHIINPKTGLPTNGIKSATIVCPDAELGDALATSIFVLGAEGGLALINKLKHVEVLIITDEDQLLFSKNLELNKV